MFELLNYLAMFLIVYQPVIIFKLLSSNQYHFPSVCTLTLHSEKKVHFTIDHICKTVVISNYMYASFVEFQFSV